MLLDRQDNRKQREIAYRQQLKNEINEKQNKNSRLKSNQAPTEVQSFSLIANIEKQQQERKKRNSEYYNQLRQQIDNERKLKKAQETEKQRKQLEEEEKIKQEQERLNERYKMELKREKGKGDKNKNQQQQDQPEQTLESSDSPKEQRQKRVEHAKYPPQILPLQSFQYSSELEGKSLLKTNQQTLPQYLYPNKIQNETYNYVAPKSYKSNYYQELLGQRKRLEEETNQIAQMNKFFAFEKYRRKEASQGLEQLRSLHKFLDDKNLDFMGLQPQTSNLTLGSSGKSPINRPTKAMSLSNNRPKDEWRKLD